MLYSEFTELYEKLAQTSKRLEKTAMLAEFLPKLKENPEYIYLLKGRVFPDYDSREFGISGQLTIKAIGKASGISADSILKKFRKIGDLGEIAEELISKKKQTTLFSSKLSATKVFENLKKIAEISGKGAVDKKMDLIVELFNQASGKEAKYIVRTLLSDLRVGVADAILIDSLAKAVSQDEKIKEKIEEAYSLATDFALILKTMEKNPADLEKISITPDKPMHVMLPIKTDSIEEAFRICGIPAALEHKYDGFRVLINKDGDKIKLFTRRLENVTNQFPDVVEAVKKHVRGDSFILDSEVVGFNPKTKKYMPFEAISQRIKRKYEIEKLIASLPVEINVFDVIYYNNKTLMNEPFSERRKLLEKIIPTIKLKIRPSYQIIVQDAKKAIKFYKEALKNGEEGIMIKKLDAPYKAGRRVGYMVKMKPDSTELDLVIVGAEYGSGKRAGWLTSYIVACRKDDQFLEVGKVSSGLKEKTGEDTSYDEMTKILKPLIILEDGKTVKVKPRVIVSVNYQNIQKSSEYSSSYAMRFPRITHYRPDRSPADIATIKDIEKVAK